MTRWILVGCGLLASAVASALTVDTGLANLQVVQADANNVAVFSLTGTAGVAGTVQAQVSSAAAEVKPWADLGPIGEGKWKGEIQGVPVGGPYKVSFRVLDAAGAPVEEASISDVLVGDLWVLAGQSNMQGWGNRNGTEEAEDPLVHVYAMNDTWRMAKDPLHVLEESHDTVHASPPDEQTRQQQVTDALARPKGTGLGMTFAKELARRTGRPIGLVACAHGGTSMDQWSPAARDQGGASLYGSMFRRVIACGGHVKGVLWYQGESDANPELCVVFKDKFTALIAAMRSDFVDPELPVIYAQLSRFVHAGLEYKSWNTVQTTQLALESAIPRVWMAAAVDLPTDDPIHVGTEGLKTLGKRMASLAETAVYGGKTGIGPRFASIARAATPFGATIRVTFTSPNGPLQAKGFVSGFSISKGADGEDVPSIYKQEVAADDPNTVVLWANELPETPHLWYGRGLAPVCTLNDAADMGVPVFGPIEIPAQ